jgi:hypothetical protein
MNNTIIVTKQEYSSLYKLKLVASNDNTYQALNSFISALSSTNPSFAELGRNAKSYLEKTASTTENIDRDKSEITVLANQEDLILSNKLISKKIDIVKLNSVLASKQFSGEVFDTMDVMIGSETNIFQAYQLASDLIWENANKDKNKEKFVKDVLAAAVSAAMVAAIVATGGVVAIVGLAGSIGIKITEEIAKKGVNKVTSVAAENLSKKTLDFQDKTEVGMKVSMIYNGLLVNASIKKIINTIFSQRAIQKKQRVKQSLYITASTLCHHEGANHSNNSITQSQIQGMNKAMPTWKWTLNPNNNKNNSIKLCH